MKIRKVEGDHHTKPRPTKAKRQACLIVEPFGEILVVYRGGKAVQIGTELGDRTFLYMTFVPTFSADWEKNPIPMRWDSIEVVTKGCRSKMLRRKQSR
jgi:hypothetical protein